MSQLGRVTGIFRYPVKSMLGTSLESTELSELGVTGDRTWAVRDEARGDFMTAKRVGALMGCRASVAADGDGVPVIELPDGASFRADDPAAGKRLSAAIGREVTLWRVDSPPPADAAATSTEEIDPEADMRALFAREGDEPMPDFSGLPTDLIAFLGKPGRPFVDLSPLLILSQQSIDAIARAASESRIDVRRFRPSLTVDAPGAGDFPEQDWIGREIRIGAARIAVMATCPRCAMTTHGFADLPTDGKVMRHLVSRAGGNLGVYAAVQDGGRIQVGDAVEAADRPEASS